MTISNIYRYENAYLQHINFEYHNKIQISKGCVFQERDPQKKQEQATLNFPQ